MNDWWQYLKGAELRLNWLIDRSPFDTSTTNVFSNTHEMKDSSKPSGFGVGYLHSVVGNRDLMVGGMLDFNWSHPLLKNIYLDDDEDGDGKPDFWKASEVEEFVWTIKAQALWNIPGTVDQFYEVGLAAFLGGGEQALTCNCDTDGGMVREGVESSDFVLQAGAELRLLCGLWFIAVGLDLVSKPIFNRANAVLGHPSQKVGYNNNGDNPPYRVTTGIDVMALFGLGKDVYDALK
ncbi:MAG: hypothetical protein HYU97_06115 [Deltaproteobacteria bacterium]|nr:hypothetical protein [Deltaproteobacteria bacterium]